MIQSKWHLKKMVQAMVTGNDDFLVVALVEFDFLVFWASIYSWEEVSVTQGVDKFVHIGKWARVANFYGVQLSVIDPE